MKFFLRLLAVMLLFSSMNNASAVSQEFVLTDMAGKQHRLSDYRGKWLLVNYWATWCPPCLEEIPDLVLMYDDHKSRDLAVIGVALQYKNRKEVADFVDDMLMSYPIVLGDTSVIHQIGPDEVLPTTFIYDPQGKLVKIRRGLIRRRDIEQLLAGKP